MKKTGPKSGAKPVHPGAFIKTEVIDEFGLSVTKAADILGVRRATLSDLFNEKSALSPEMALRLEMAFDLNMDTLLNMQAWYDASEMRKQAKKMNISPYAQT
ncbi:HigA family addiction module antitoxin [Candidatus Nitrospira salsa]|nr:MAG: transcriptional regulator [Nitrospirales bacterium]